MQITIKIYILLVDEKGLKYFFVLMLYYSNIILKPVNCCIVLFLKCNFGNAVVFTTKISMSVISAVHTPWNILMHVKTPFDSMREYRHEETGRTYK